MTDFYLMSGGDLSTTRRIADKLGREGICVYPISKTDGGFSDIGKRYIGKGHVFVVDDHEPIGRAVQRMLAEGKSDGEVVYFADPEQALNSFLGQKPAAVVTDLNMEKYGLNGDELIRRMNKNGKKR